MNRSTAIGELSSALAKAQGEFQAIKKTKTAKIKSQKGDYSYAYADLADVIDATTPALVKHGLAIAQPVEILGDRGYLYTQLSHSSGEFISSCCEFPTASDRMQEIGSRITYLRRYALSGFLGVCSEADDDGAAGDGHQSAPTPQSAASAPINVASGPKLTAPPLAKTRVVPQTGEIPKWTPPPHITDDVPFDFDPPGTR